MSRFKRSQGALALVAVLLMTTITLTPAPSGIVAQAHAAAKKCTKKKKRCKKAPAAPAPASPMTPASPGKPGPTDPTGTTGPTNPEVPDEPSVVEEDHEELPFAPPGQDPSEWSEVQPDSGGSLPAWRLPFGCNEVWRGATYGGHGAGNYALDLNHDNAAFEANASALAALGGQVVVAADGWNGGYGNYVVVDHGGGWSSLYAHLRARHVSRGQAVHRGQPIGIVGTTGNSNGNHLHFEQRLGGNLVHISFDGAHIPYSYSYPGPAFRSTNCGGDPVPAFTASMDDQINPAPIMPGQRTVSGFNIRMSQPYESYMVLRPDPQTVGNIGHFLRLAGALPGNGDYPGARASNDDKVGYFRAGIEAAPDTTRGHYFLRWSIVNQRTGQVAGPQPSFWVTVGNPSYARPDAHSPWDAAFAGYDRDPLIDRGEESCVAQRIRNTGWAFWGPTVRLGTLDDSPIRYGTSGIVNRNRVNWTDQDNNGTVSPGETATFRYCIKSDQADAWRQRLRMVNDGPNGGRFGDPGLYIPMLVADQDHVPALGAEECTWAWVTQGGSPIENDRVVVSDTQTGKFSFTIRNTSELCPWFPNGSAPFRLATDRTQDHASGFVDLSDGWISPNRVRLPEVVPPGGTVTIPLGLKPAANVPVGKYSEYLNPVIDGRYHLSNRAGMHILIDRR